MSITNERIKYVKQFEEYLHSIKYPKENLKNELEKFANVIFNTIPISQIKIVSEDYIQQFDEKYNRSLEQGTIFTTTQNQTEEAESTIKKEHDDIKMYLSELEASHKEKARKSKSSQYITAHKQQKQVTKQYKKL